MTVEQTNEIVSQEKIQTLDEYLQEERKLEEEAAETFPLRIDTCSYNEGYVKQDLYACLTCSKDEFPISAVCYACSISCHAEHELVELWNKRNFRCDCGTLALKSACNLEPKKDQLNENKSISEHNFKGRFCKCDSTVNEQEEMLMFQCLICEDWFHDDCIGPIPPAESFQDFICNCCVSKNSFLVKFSNTEKIFTVESFVANQEKKIKEKDLDIETFEPIEAIENSAIATETATTAEAVKTDDAVKSTFCVSSMPDSESEAAPLFLAEGWRSSICKCSECMKLFNGLIFLIQEEQVYTPEEDPEKDESTYQLALKKLESVERSSASFGIEAFNNLKNKLFDYLKPFADGNKVVKKEDIDEFFKKRKTE